LANVQIKSYRVTILARRLMGAWKAGQLMWLLPDFAAS
jgi:hypothetical protein